MDAHAPSPWNAPETVEGLFVFTFSRNTFPPDTQPVAGLEWPSVAAQLDEALHTIDEVKDSPSWAEASLSELMAHILDRYHAKLRDDLPMLSAMGEKVVGAHGEASGGSGTAAR